MLRRSHDRLVKWTAAVAAATLVACGPREAPRTNVAPSAVPLHLEPACDLAPAAGLAWIVDVRPRAIADIPDLVPAIASVLPEERFERFATAHGGIDLRRAHELCVARYPQSTLSIVRVDVQPERVASAFDARGAKPSARRQLAPNPLVLRLSGEHGEEPEQALVFGTFGAALEQGKPGPLRVAEAFAFGRLKRAAPALRGAALARATALLGDAPVRVLAPGPFEGDSGKALGGLVRAATAVGGAVKWSGVKSDLTVRLVLTGAWGEGAAAARERLAAAVHVFRESAAGRLFGLDHLVREPRIWSEPDALIVDATIDGDALARGVRDAVIGDIDAIMSPAPRRSPPSP